MSWKGFFSRTRHFQSVFTAYFPGLLLRELRRLYTAQKKSLISFHFYFHSFRLEQWMKWWRRKGWVRGWKEMTVCTVEKLLSQHNWDFCVRNCIIRVWKYLAVKIGDKLVTLISCDDVTLWLEKSLILEYFANWMANIDRIHYDFRVWFSYRICTNEWEFSWRYEM